MPRIPAPKPLNRRIATPPTMCSNPWHWEPSTATVEWASGRIKGAWHDYRVWDTPHHRKYPRHHTNVLCPTCKTNVRVDLLGEAEVPDVLAWRKRRNMKDPPSRESQKSPKQDERAARDDYSGRRAHNAVNVKTGDDGKLITTRPGHVMPRNLQEDRMVRYLDHVALPSHRRRQKFQRAVQPSLTTQLLPENKTNADEPVTEGTNLEHSETLVLVDERNLAEFGHCTKCGCGGDGSCHRLIDKHDGSVWPAFDSGFRVGGSAARRRREIINHTNWAFLYRFPKVRGQASKTVPAIRYGAGPRKELNDSRPPANH